MRALPALLAASLLACGGAPEPELDEQQAAEAAAISQTAPAEPEAPPAADAELVPIEIKWEGVGDLYKQFFQDQPALTELSRRLAPYVEGPVQLRIHYDAEEFIGGIRVVVPPGGWVKPPSARAGVVDLQSVAPVTAALATYRDAIAASYDLRVQSLFSIGVDLFRGARLCELEPVGEPPPDGRTVSPCPVVNGEAICGTPEAGGVRFSDEAWGKVSGCFKE